MKDLVGEVKKSLVVTKVRRDCLGIAKRIPPNWRLKSQTLILLVSSKSLRSYLNQGQDEKRKGRKVEIPVVGEDSWRVGSEEEPRLRLLDRVKKVRDLVVCHRQYSRMGFGSGICSCMHWYQKGKTRESLTYETCSLLQHHASPDPVRCTDHRGNSQLEDGTLWQATDFFPYFNFLLHPSSICTAWKPDLTVFGPES